MYSMVGITCQLEVEIILHVKDAENYVSARRRRDCSCTELPNICTKCKRSNYYKKKRAL